MPEFRVEGVMAGGKIVRGTINADSLKEARGRSRELARDQRLRNMKVHRRVAFLYRVKQADGRAIRGEQRAYTKEEVWDASEKDGVPRCVCPEKAPRP